MNDLEGLLHQITRDLNDQGAAAALVGGIAISVRTEPRFTRDVDLAVAVDGDEEAQAFVRAMADRGWRVTTTLMQDAVGRLAAVRLDRLEDGPAGRVVDLLFASSGIEPEIVAAAEELEVLPGIRARVARIGHLIVLKALARADDRPQDAADLVGLMEAARPDDLREAREAAALVVDRGFDRGKDLIGEIDGLTRGR